MLRDLAHGFRVLALPRVADIQTEMAPLLVTGGPGVRVTDGSATGTITDDD